MSYSPELELWRGHQRELLQEAETSRLARRALRARREGPPFKMGSLRGSLRGALARFEALVRPFEKGPGAVPVGVEEGGGAAAVRRKVDSRDIRKGSGIARSPERSTGGS